MQPSARTYAIALPAAAALLVALAGCSKPGPGNAASSPPSSGSSAAASAPSGNACDRKLLTAADVSSILSGPITVGPLEGDPQTCIFTAGDNRVTVSLRPGVGDATVQTVLSGGENVAATPLSGVGDKAAWTSILHEVNATKNNLLCDIQSAGTAGATQQAVGALCNKIFAAS
jgi:hypothetical protein